LISFFGISWDRKATDGQFEAQGEFNSRSDDGVVAEDFFHLFRVFGVSSDPDAGLGIGGQFGASEEEGVDLIETDTVEVDLSGNDIEAMGF
jgi:hypothetical protein